ncbi:sugar ABC transporter permease [Conexibacter sp. JD483]|uniref:carbohydrate ABC transporter permease n=1 Tax=unclassified Conexibacter TaxID=2627773 RepID=UPI002718A5D9|nr:MULTISPECIES: sugar ABC transporter permease [unclassified Conexibacter]MDO8188404.1 sugar ABC transporter permease [Conexibacter sp. CPCC 205706]MDO8198191.1 sugar ABC transporter permease [Conexibacter sp. CPCC 205762]MDR9370673.1 sugar ABC transporter permease [Conexibacter sp. JD483]
MRTARQNWWAAGLLAPSVGLIGVFVLIPIVLTLWLSLHRWSTATPFGDAEWVGLRNFDALFSSALVGRDFRQALRNTFVYAGLSIALLIPLSILFGVIVHRAAVRGTTFLRTVLFATYCVPMIAVAIVWSKLYSPTEGPVNQALGWFGIGPQPWLSDTGTALISLVFLNVWQQLGYFTVLVVAGLTQIPPSVYEAAALDGARNVKLLFKITLPLLRRTLLFCVVIALINAIQVFEPVATITQGGPVGSTNVLTYHIRQVGIERSQGGLASAMAVTLLLALMAVVTLVFALMRKGDDR